MRLTVTFALLDDGTRLVVEGFDTYVELKNYIDLARARGDRCRVINVISHGAARLTMEGGREGLL